LPRGITDRVVGRVCLRLVFGAVYQRESIGEAMAVPKRKTSKSRLRMRKASHKTQVVTSKPCPECGAPQVPHRVCKSCGYYRGRQVITVDVD
jgi:large subunit ribosomal protein L32